MGWSPLATGQRGNIVLGCLDESLVERKTITLFGCFLFFYFFTARSTKCDVADVSMIDVWSCKKS